MEPDLARDSPRRDVMRTAERGRKVVQRRLVGEVNHRNARAPLIPVAVKQVIVADCNVCVHSPVSS